MTYENFQNLGSEAKNQETGKGEWEGVRESPECALTMSIKVSVVVSHHAPGCPLPLPEPLTLHVEGPQGHRDRKSDLKDTTSCALWEGIGGVHGGSLGLEKFTVCSHSRAEAKGPIMA